MSLLFVVAMPMLSLEWVVPRMLFAQKVALLAKLKIQGPVPVAAQQVALRNKYKMQTAVAVVKIVVLLVKLKIQRPVVVAAKLITA